MEEICVKVDIHPDFKEEFRLALAKIIKELADKLELVIAEEIVSKSKFSEYDVDELSEKVKLSMHEQLKNEVLL